MARMRRAHFKIDGPGIRLNGAHRGRLTIEDAAGRQLVRVRPLRQREYVLPLRTVAEMVIWRVVRNELATQGRVTPAGSHLRGRAVASQY